MAQVKYHSTLESRLPAAFLKQVDKSSLAVYPNRKKCWIVRVWKAVR